MTIRAAILLAILATTCFQVGLLLQKVGADRLPQLRMSLRQGRVLLSFLRSPPWLGGTAISAVGWVLLLAAIANAPVSIIQPVAGSGLALMAVFSVVVLRERMSRLEAAGVVTTIAGLVLLGSSASEPVEASAVAFGPLVAVTLGFMALLAVGWSLGGSGRVPVPVVLGAGAGLLIGLGSLLTKALFELLAGGQALTGWLVILPLVVAVNIGGLGVMQAGFQRGRALIVTAVCAVATKIVAIVGGMATLGESLPDDAALAAARIGGLVAIVAGTVALSRFGGRETSRVPPPAPLGS